MTPTGSNRGGGARDLGLGAALRISAVAARLGVSLRTLRHYEAEGLLTAIRSRQGVRHFSVAEAERARRIVALRRVGVSLDEVRCLLDDAQTDSPDTAVRAVLEARAKALELQLAALRRLLFNRAAGAGTGQATS